MDNNHYLAEIKYPTIPDPIGLEKILSVLQKIRHTTKPLTFKWLPIDRPKNGELFLEQKYPLTRDTVNGDQFPIVDDGYLWASIPRPEIKEIQGQMIEIYRWNEGFSLGDSCYTVSKIEYRLRLPGNILFLIHYLHVKTPIVPITRPALPASKVSSLYLQQQFIQNSIQAPIPTSTSTSTSTSKVTPPQRVNSPRQAQQAPPSAMKQEPTSNVLGGNEPSIDAFDTFTSYDAAAYRFLCTKTALNALFEVKDPVTDKESPLMANPELAPSLIAAMEKKCLSIESRMQKHRTEQAERLQALSLKRSEFADACERIQAAQSEQELHELMNELICESAHESVLVSL